MTESLFLRWLVPPVLLEERWLLKISQWLLAALVFFSLFSPRLPAGILASSYQIYLRLDDFIFVALLFLIFPVMMRSDSSYEFFAFEKAFLIFLFACGLSILNGFYWRTVDKPFLSLFSLLKWLQYFLVFVMSAWISRNSRRPSFFLKIFFLLGLAIAAYGYWEYFSPASKAVYPYYYRLYERTPFHGDANHIGGFLALWIAFFTGVFLKEGNRLKASALIAAILFVFFPLVWTYSRKSYFALAGALSLAFVVVPQRKKLLSLICLFVIFGLLMPTRLSERLTDLGDVFTSVDPFHTSWAGDFDVWKKSFWNFGKFFLLGSGWAVRHRLYYESQYVQILTETGVVGFTAFLFLMGNLIKVGAGLKPAPTVDNVGLKLGWLLAFFVFLIHSFSCVSWTITKMAVPFWFLTGFVFASFHSEKESTDASL